MQLDADDVTIVSLNVRVVGESCCGCRRTVSRKILVTSSSPDDAVCRREEISMKTVHVVRLAKDVVVFFRTALQLPPIC